jgi:hypothetical protein
MSATQKGHDDETSEEQSSDSDDGQQQSLKDMTMSKVLARAQKRSPETKSEAGDAATRGASGSAQDPREKQDGRDH